MTLRFTRGRRFVVAASVIALAGSLAACGAPLDTDAGVQVPIADLRVHLSASLQEEYYHQVVEWQKCDKVYFCTEITVPLDWHNPTYKSVQVALIKHPATGTRLGSLLVDPGGPGGSGVQLVDDGVDNAVDATVAEHYDVIGFDPRGVGLSNPAITCLNDKQEDAYLYAPTVGTIGSASWIKDQEHRSKALWDACRKNTGPLIGTVDGLNVAHDMDVIRAALGEKKLNYLGYSYGTYLGTLYAGLYPQNVGRFVFDGPYNPWADDGGTGGIGGDDTQAVGFDDDLKAFLESCLSGAPEAIGHATCAFSGSLAKAEKTVEGLLASADRHPIPNSDGRVMDGATLATAISAALYSTSEWPELNKTFSQVIAGTATEAFVLADEYNGRDSDGKYDNNSSVAFDAISCLEDGHEVDLQYDASELKALKKQAPMMGQYNSYGDLLCSAWTDGPTVFPDPIHATTAGPILLVATTGDPATPYSDAKQLADQLTTSHLVTFHGEGHTAYDEGHACVDAAVDNYLVEGIVPKGDIDCTS